MASTAASTVASTALHSSNSPALKFRVVAECSRSRARVSVMTLPHDTVNLPTFMPVGTKGTMKGLIPQQVKEAGAEIILGNTYHLGTRPGKETMETLGGLHKMMGWDRPLLTDSGGFQMVSLSALTKITEEGVTFQSPFDESEILLTPEESISIQNAIGADIMMQLDDVVNVVETDYERFKTATYRTTRWLDRCMAANKNPEQQNLFPIIQGGLFSDLRDISLTELTARDAPGFAIGGLSGGEEKDKFWKVVHQCTGRLPRSKPRYCMGVGFAVDLVVCCALGVDMYDCVFPTRTARFGCALVEGGQMNLKMKQYASDFRAIDDTCDCSTCTNYTRAYLHTIVTRYPVACHLISIHNIAYQMRLMRNIRTSITEGRFPEFVQDFMAGYYPDGNYPGWLTDALNAVNIQLRKTDNTASQEKEARTSNPAAGESTQEHAGGATVETIDSDRKTEGKSLRNQDKNVLGSEAVGRKRKIEAKEVKENSKKEVVDRKRAIGAEVFEDDDDEEWEGAGEIAAQRSGFDKLQQTGYREGVLDEYPDQEASGRAAGWQTGLNFLRSDPSLVLAPSSLSRTQSDHKAQSDPNQSLAHSILSSVEPCATPTMASTKISTAEPNLNPVFALAKLSGALLACRGKLDLNPEQDSQAAELLKEIEVEVARISQSPPTYVLEEWRLREAGAEGRKGCGKRENMDSEGKKMGEKRVSNKERVGCQGEEGTCKGACGNREAEQNVIDLEQSGGDSNISGKEISQQEASTKPISVTTSAANPEGETTKRRLRSLQDRVHVLYQSVGWTLSEF